jgi:hypothetical protein
MKRTLTRLASPSSITVARQEQTDARFDLQGAVGELRVAVTEDLVGSQLGPELRPQRGLHVDLREYAGAFALEQLASSALRGFEVEIRVDSKLVAQGHLVNQLLVHAPTAAVNSRCRGPAARDGSTSIAQTGSWMDACAGGFAARAISA